MEKNIDPTWMYLMKIVQITFDTEKCQSGVLNILPSVMWIQVRANTKKFQTDLFGT